MNYFTASKELIFHYILSRVSQGTEEDLLPAAGLVFNVTLSKTANERQRLAQLQRLLMDYKREKRGPTFIAVQSAWGRELITDIIKCSLRGK